MKQSFLNVTPLIDNAQSTETSSQEMQKMKNNRHEITDNIGSFMIISADPVSLVLETMGN